MTLKAALVTLAIISVTYGCKENSECGGLDDTDQWKCVPNTDLSQNLFPATKVCREFPVESSEAKKLFMAPCENDDECEQSQDLECRKYCVIFDCDGTKKCQYRKKQIQLPSYSDLMSGVPERIPHPPLAKN